ncbi:hypothetical protein E4U43_000168 [Claviceps pusilla]|uniref:Uncharacterized protein n=1 Tax=Claviceps pusilla TaxID=123648 RepID=A0A9P7SXW6_9HYPO|nr:hypothetical protein E4U43_000168 [Claviceps pusilla]
MSQSLSMSAISILSVFGLLSLPSITQAAVFRLSELPDLALHRIIDYSAGLSPLQRLSPDDLEIAWQIQEIRDVISKWFVPTPPTIFTTEVHTLFPVEVPLQGKGKKRREEKREK